MSLTPHYVWNQHGESVADLLAARAATQGDRPYIHLEEDNGQERTFTFAEVAAGARRAAAHLQGRGVRPGDRVALVLPTGRAFVEAFFGTLLAGAVAVPVYPPLRAKGLSDYQDRLARLLGNARPRAIVTFKKVKLVVEAAAFQAGVGAGVLEEAALDGDAPGFQPVPIGGDDVALVQYSSGSTGHPRGVVLSHRNLLANLAAVLDVVRPGPEDVNCSWLPLYHDMGLIGGLLMPLFSGNPLVLLSPQAFLLDPKRWLWAIHRHRASVSTAPNFAYQLVASRVDDRELQGLDLSCWRLALSGAEPVVPATLQAFTSRMAAYGFDEAALLPVYGLAEVALGAIFPPPRRGPRLDRIDAEVLAARGRAEPAPERDDRVSLLLPSVGGALPGFAVRVVAEDGTVRGEREVGEIQLQGPSVMQGYLEDPAATSAAFDGAWLRTGDLGYLAEGELFIVGRLKDVILKGGRNYAPQDVERAAEDVAGVRRGCVAAFGVADGATGTESVVVVAETREPAERHAGLARAIADRVHAATGLRPDHVSLTSPGAVPKTSSGKLQRGRCRERWQAGTLTAPVAPSLLAKTRVLGQALAQRALAGARTPRGRTGRPTHG